MRQQKDGKTAIGPVEDHGPLNHKAILADAPRLVAWGIKKGLLTKPGLSSKANHAEVNRRILNDVLSSVS